MPKTRDELVKLVDAQMRDTIGYKRSRRAKMVVDLILAELDITLAPIVGETKR